MCGNRILVSGKVMLRGENSMPVGGNGVGVVGLKVVGLGVGVGCVV